MININIQAPDYEELEITTLGPGSNNGESLVIHINGKWYIVDSFLVSGKPAALIYLESIGVNFDSVTHIICSHWHMDHIEGLEQLLASCANADFYVPCVGGKEANISQLLKLCELQGFDCRAWKIYLVCLDVLSDRNQIPQLLTHDQVLLKMDKGTVEVHALGPSNQMMISFETSLLQLNPDSPSEEQIEKLNENLYSVALSINYYGTSCLLGGDVESGRKQRYKYHLCTNGCCEHEDCGWCDIKLHSVPYDSDKPFSLVKIPHHSSASAYCPQMWPKDFTESPISTSTLFNCGRGESLPTKEMLTLYYSHTEELYMTGTGEKKIKPVENSEIVDIDRSKNIELLETPVAGLGIVVCRIKPGEKDWRVKAFGSAIKVDDQFVANYHKN